MIDMIQSPAGLIHFLSGVVALLTGTLVLFLKKGTRLHVRVGYVYVVSMVVLLVSSFLIYRLFDGWGIFHYASIVSSVSVIAGVVPPLFLRHKSYWGRWHLTAMYWSVVGLWAAFIGEMSVRIPESSFMWMVGLAFGAVILVGVIIFAVKKSGWVAFARKYPG